ncbi:PAS domain S-box-containing protein [Saccharothrix tamanrassetensis]|uniref:PAS domain S-box-containing protein n=1 Tax=Saccharothrix tamanrassetensis TaxID=1051531 RepID=A0A841CXH5_9PSEU|nr:SpoIIE family protein phosphatase [Saccharothrix tamanrassetensis]MBB5960687.1 PAS domain S-box-containing protein [Saccharothrix tamanrassetensis]
MPNDPDSLLRDATRVLAPLLDSAPVGFAMFDTDLRYLYINPALAAMHGLPPHEHLGRTMGELFAPGHVAPVEPGIREVVECGAVHRDAELRFDVDGLPRHFKVNRFPLRGSDGAVVAAAVMVQDVTEARLFTDLESERGGLRLRAEWAQRLEQAQRIGGVGSWELDLRDGSVVWSPNLCRIVGLAGSPSTLDEVLDLVHPDDLDATRGYYGDLVAGAGPAEAETRLRRPDGTVVVLSSVAEAVRDGSGALIGLHGVCADRTARRQAEAQARAASAQAATATAHLHAEQQVVLRLQRALLPPRIPEVAGVELAAAYEPSDTATGVGGDFYDAFTVSGDRLAIAVGDVVGHDVEAAVTMGRVRNAIRAYAMRDPSPDRLLAELNRLVCTDPDLVLTSVFYAVYTPESGLLRYANAGHPHPILVSGDGIGPLEHRHGLILGVRRDADYREQHILLAPRDLLLCYTDGLVERRGSDLDAGTRALCDTLGSPLLPERPDLLAPLLISLLAPATSRDDICVLALRRT